VKENTKARPEGNQGNESEEMIESGGSIDMTAEARDTPVCCHEVDKRGKGPAGLAQTQPPRRDVDDVSEGFSVEAEA
jgi:hypothetical protein